MEKVRGQTREGEQRPMYKDPPPVEYVLQYLHINDIAPVDSYCKGRLWLQALHKHDIRITTHIARLQSWFYIKVDYLLSGPKYKWITVIRHPLRVD